MVSNCMLESSGLQVRKGVQDGGKENVDPAAKPRPARIPRSKKEAPEEEDVAHCTQIPATRSKTLLKRTRNQEQGNPCSEGGNTTPRTPRISRPRKVTSASECNLQALQTPMPESQPGSELGPPPPDTTPAPLRKSSSAIIVFHSPYFEVGEARIVFKLVSMLCGAARIEITIAGNITCICK